jgi:Ca-activated chloride channel family protein
MSEPVFAASHLPEPGPRMPAIHDVMPQQVPDLFEGDQLVILGRYTTTAGGVRMRLEGEYLGQHKTFEFALNPAQATTANSFVPRLWASRKIAFLLDEVRQAGVSGDVRSDPRTKELIDEVVKLSMRWGILTEYTSFLAEDPSGAPVAVRSHDEQVGLAMETAAARTATRDGAGAVNQSMNLKAAAMQSCANNDNTYWTADMKQTRVTTVMQVADQTLFCRSGKWIDSNLVDKPDLEKPDVTITFGSAEHFELVRKLAAADNGTGRQALLALRGAVYLLVDGKRILICAPEDDC